jgi:hypothetical protein
VVRGRIDPVAERFRPAARPSRGIGITMLVFGASDLVEMRTGAWWSPWWLFAWKAACVLLLLAGFVRYFRMVKKCDATAKTDEDMGQK